MMKRREVFISLGALAASVVLLSALWAHLATSTIYSKPGVGPGTYNPYATHPDRPLPW